MMYIQNRKIAQLIAFYLARWVEIINVHRRPLYHSALGVLLLLLLLLLLLAVRLRILSVDLYSVVSNRGPEGQIY